jgi:hypothetical protein
LDEIHHLVEVILNQVIVNVEASYWICVSVPLLTKKVLQVLVHFSFDLFSQNLFHFFELFTLIGVLGVYVIIDLLDFVLF